MPEGTYDRSADNVALASLSGHSFEWEAAIGRLDGYETRHVVGRRTNFRERDGLVTVWNGAPNQFTNPSAGAFTIEAVSSADASLAVSVRGLNEAGELQSVQTTANAGTLPGTWKFVWQVAVTGTAMNAGTIIVRDALGQETCRVDAAEDISYSGIWICPDSHVTMIRQAIVTGDAQRGRKLPRVWLSLEPEGAPPRRLIELPVNHSTTFPLPIRVRSGIEMKLVGEAPENRDVSVSVYLSVLLLDWQTVKVGRDFDDSTIPD